MASKKTLNAKNLAALGVARLSELLIEITKGDGTAKRRLRFELAGTLTASGLQAETGARIDPSLPEGYYSRRNLAYLLPPQTPPPRFAKYP